MANNLPDFSRRDFVRGTGATIVALSLTNSPLEALALQQEPRIVSVQEAINDENNATGIRQLFIDQAGNWVMSRMAQELPEKKVYWVDKLVYDHAQKNASSYAASHRMVALTTPTHLGDEKVYGVLASEPKDGTGIGQIVSAFFFSDTLDKLFKPEYPPQQLNLPESIDASEETVRMHVASAVNLGYSMYHEIDLGNGLRIDEGNARTISPVAYGVITMTGKFIRDIDFAGKYLSKQAVDFAVASLANFAIQISGYRIKENAQSDYERKLLEANENRIIPFVKQYGITF